MLIKVGARTIEYPPLGDTREEKEIKWCAGIIADYLHKKNCLAGGQNGPNRRDCPQTWRYVAEAYLHCHVHVFHDPCGDFGEYRRTQRGTGVILYNTAATEYMQARALVHELAHHLMWELTLLPIDCENPVYFSERVARLVELLVVG